MRQPSTRVDLDAKRRPFSILSRMALVLVALLGTLGPMVSGDLAPIGIGLVVPVTGALSEYWNGEHALQLVEELIAELNASGGVAGRQISLDIRDSESDRETAAVHAEELFARPDTLAVIGGVYPEAAEALASAACGRGIAVTLADAWPPSPCGEVLALGLSSGQLAELLVRAASETNHTNIAVLVGPEPSLASFAVEMQVALDDSDSGGEARVISFDGQEASMPDVVAEVRALAPSTLLMPLAYGDDAARIADILLSQGIRKSLLLWPFAVVPELFSSAGKHSYSQQIIGVQIVSGTQGRLLDAVALLLASISLAGGPDVEAILDAAAGLANPPGEPFFPAIAEPGFGIGDRRIEDLDFFGLSGNVNCGGLLPSTAHWISWAAGDRELLATNAESPWNSVAVMQPIYGFGAGHLPPPAQPESAAKKAVDAAVVFVNGALAELEYAAEAYFDYEVEVDGVPDLLFRWGQIIALQCLSVTAEFAFGPGAGQIAEALVVACERLLERAADFIGRKAGEWIVRHGPGDERIVAGMESMLRALVDTLVAGPML